MTTLAAERVGDQVLLHWTTPEKTTDGPDVRGPMAAMICRLPGEPPARPCVTVLRLTVVAGPSSAVDRLPPTLLTGPAVVVEYRLQILNARGRSAGESNAALVADGPAPAIPRGLQVTASREGAALTWQVGDTRDTLELHRTTPVSIMPAKQPVIGGKKIGSADTILRVKPGGGALDRTVEMGGHYIYTAQRVRTVIIGDHVLEVRSTSADPVSIEMRDVFPPHRPTGLEAVAADNVVDLSWEPNTEVDLVGYLVQRQESTLAKLLNTSPVPQPSFQDKTVVPGHTYQYSVVAVDRAGNRSPGSELVQVSLAPNIH